MELWRWLSWTLFVSSALVWTIKILIYWRKSGKPFIQALNELRIGVVLVLAGFSGASVLVADLIFTSKEVQEVFINGIRLVFSIVLFSTTFKQPHITKKG